MDEETGLLDIFLNDLYFNDRSRRLADTCMQNYKKLDRAKIFLYNNLTYMGEKEDT